MIQRVQSIYLFLIALLYVAMMFLKIADITLIDEAGGKEVINYYLNSAIKSSDGSSINTKNNLFLSIIAILIFLFSLITVFLYRKRLMQLKLGKGILFLNIILIVLLFFYSDMELKSYTSVSSAEISYELGAYIPLITILLIFLTNRAIKKDEDLVRSADRLR